MLRSADVACGLEPLRQATLQLSVLDAAQFLGIELVQELAEPAVERFGGCAARVSVQLRDEGSQQRVPFISALAGQV